MKKIVYLMLMLFSLPGFLFAAESENKAISAEEFYKNSTLEIIVPLNPGGGMDTAARISAPFLKEILGVKNVIVKNMTGAGGLKAYNWMYLSAPSDGATICFGTDPVLDQVVLENKAVRFDAAKFNYIGVTQHAEFALVVSPKGPYTNIEAIKKAKNFKMGSFAAYDTMAAYAVAAFEMLDLSSPKLIGGYKGSSAVLLAIAQEEVDAYACPVDSLHRYVKAGRAAPVFVYGSKRDPYWPDVPAITELVELPSKKKDMLTRLWGSNRTVFAPPGVPEDRLRFLSESLAKMMTDQKYKDETIKATGYTSDGKTSAEVTTWTNNVITNAEEYKNTFLPLINKYIQK